MTLEELKTKVEKAERSISNPMIQSNPAILDAIVKNIEKYKKEISDMEAAVETKVEKAEDKLADAETKAEIKDAKADLKDAKEEKKEVEKTAEKVEKIEDKAEKKQGGIREGSGRPKKMEIKKGDWRKIKSGAGKKAKASSPTKMMKPKSVKIDREPVTEKVKKVRAFGQVVEYKNDSEFCKQLIKAFKKRRKASKKDGKRRKTKPVFGVITTSVKNAVSKALHSVSEKEIEKNPKAFLAKAERLEKSAIRFLEDFKAILGSDYKKSEITSEFGDLEKSIKAFVGKFMDKKYANGGGVGVGSYKNHKIGDMVEVWQFGGGSKIKKIVGFEDKEHNHYILEDEKGNKSYTPKKYIANLSGEFPFMNEYANGGGVDEEVIVRNKNKNDWKSKFDFYLKYNNSPIGKGKLMEMAYENTRGVDSAIPQDLWGEVDDTYFYVYDYTTKNFGELVDLRDKLKFSNVIIDVTIVKNGDVLYGDRLPEELQNVTFHQALNYVFNDDNVEAFDIRAKNSKYAKGGGINSGRDYIFKSQEPHEQRYKRKRDWKEYE